jgi:hypothetical protein
VISRVSGFERIMKRTKLRVKGISDVSQIKSDIQDVVRDIVIARDRVCILSDYGRFYGSGIPNCNGYAKDGHLILQADHLIERSNSATYADTRLIVCVCIGHHGWKHFKKSNHDRYDQLIKQLISPERVALWEACEKDSWRPVRTSKYDWGLALVALHHELKGYN